MKHILFLNHTGSIFGSETVLLENLSGLIREKSLKLYAIYLKSSNEEFENALKEIGITHSDTVYYKMMDQVFWRAIIKIALSICAFFRIWKYVRQNKIDIIYSNTSINIYGILIAKLTGRKHIWHFHEQPYRESRYINSAFFRLYRSLLSYSKNIVVFTSKKQKEAWETMLQITTPNCKVIYNPIKKIQQQPLNTGGYDISFGYLGGFTDIPKNISTLLDCFKRLVIDEPNIRCQLILKGEGPLKGRIKQMIAANYLEERIKLWEYSNDISSFFSAINVLLLPSYYESWGLVVLEAISAGKRAIVTSNSAVSELIPKGYCTYIDPYNKNSLYEAMKVMLTMPVLTKVEVENFNKSIDDTNNRFHQTIKEVIFTI